MRSATSPLCVFYNLLLFQLLSNEKAITFNLLSFLKNLHQMSCLQLCEKCRKNRPCKKSLKIERLPSVLIIQLNRFSIDFRNKIDIPVQAPLEHMCLVAHMTTADKESNMNHSNSSEKYKHAYWVFSVETS